MSLLIEQISFELAKTFQLLKDENFEQFSTQLEKLYFSFEEFSEFYSKHKRLQQLKLIYSTLVTQMLSLQQAYMEMLDDLENYISKQQALNAKYKDVKNILDNPKKSELYDFLTTAKNCSLTRFAPAGFSLQTPIEPFKPPVPTEDMMRQSVLYNQKLEIVPSKSLLPPTDDSQKNIIHTLQNQRTDGNDQEMLLLDLNP